MDFKKKDFKATSDPWNFERIIFYIYYLLLNKETDASNGRSIKAHIVLASFSTPLQFAFHMCDPFAQPLFGTCYNSVFLGISFDMIWYHGILIRYTSWRIHENQMIYLSTVNFRPVL